MELKQTRFGRLVVDYVVDEDNIHCTCDCGTQIIVTEKQLRNNCSCGCIHREMLLALSGESDDYQREDTHKTDPAIDRGINFDKKKNKWRVRVTYQFKEYHIGYFPDKESAINIRKEAESNLYGNFIEWYNNYKAKAKGDLR
jgi:hypothetical protein